MHFSQAHRDHSASVGRVATVDDESILQCGCPRHRRSCPHNERSDDRGREKVPGMLCRKPLGRLRRSICMTMSKSPRSVLQSAYHAACQALPATSAPVQPQEVLPAPAPGLLGAQGIPAHGPRLVNGTDSLGARPHPVRYQPDAPARVGPTGPSFARRVGRRRQSPIWAHEPQFARFKAKYGQRWQTETVNSMIKRRLGSACRRRSYWSQCREIILRVITHNVMIVASG